MLEELDLLINFLQIEYTTNVIKNIFLNIKISQKNVKLFLHIKIT